MDVAVEESDKNMETVDDQDSTDSNNDEIDNDGGAGSEADEKDTPADDSDEQENSDDVNDNSDKKVTEFIGGGPELHANSVHINPKQVYYKDDSLVMVAWVTNGHQTTAFNIHDVEIRVSNKEGVIAHGYFGQLEGLQIGPGSSAEWTFVFSNDALINKDADLGYLETEYSNSYNH